MPLLIVRLVLICKAMDFAYMDGFFNLSTNSISIYMATELSKIHCLTYQNKPDNGQRHRVSHGV